MDPFFTGIEPVVATRMAGLSRQMFELRERHKELLEQLDCEDADAVLAAVREGRLPEHPGYEAWLALELMRERQQAARELLDWHCRHIREDGEWPAIADGIPDGLPATFLVHPPERHLDGLGLRDEDGLEVLARVLTPRDWSFEWRRGDRLWRLVTAPVSHPGLPAAGGPHLHLPDGAVVAPDVDVEAADCDALIGIVLRAIADGRLPAAHE